MLSFHAVFLQREKLEREDVEAEWLQAFLKRPSYQICQQAGHLQGEAEHTLNLEGMARWN